MRRFSEPCLPPLGVSVATIRAAAAQHNDDHGDNNADYDIVVAFIFGCVTVGLDRRRGCACDVTVKRIAACSPRSAPRSH